MRECISCFEKKPLTEYRQRCRPLKDGSPCYLRKCKSCYIEASREDRPYPARGKAIPTGDIPEKFLVRGRIYYEGYNYGT